MSSIDAVPTKFKTKPFLDKITSAARKAQSLTPKPGDIAASDAATKRLLDKISALFQDILSTSEWTDERLISLAREADWAHTSVQLSVSGAGTKGGNVPEMKGGQTGPTNCSNDYDKCMQENGCTYSFPCFCCLPCVVGYVGCMRKILIDRVGGGGSTGVGKGDENAPPKL
jgi:hypothetical protein